MKSFIDLFSFLIVSLLLASCSAPKPDSENINAETIISKGEYDSIVEKTGVVPARKNVQAMIGNEKWMSITFTINVYQVKEKKIYSIFSTDGNSQLTMNYSGPEKPGIVNVGSMLEAGFRENDGTTYSCANGFMEITKFDLIEKKISGRFKLHCSSIKNDNRNKDFDGGVFTDLIWQ